MFVLTPIVDPSSKINIWLPDVGNGSKQPPVDEIRDDPMRESNKTPNKSNTWHKLLALTFFVFLLSSHSHEHISTLHILKTSVMP